MHAAQSYGMMDNSASDRLRRVPGHDDLRRAVEGGRLEPLLLHRPAGIVVLGRGRACALEPGAALLRAGRRGHAARAVVRRPVVQRRGPGHLRRRAPARRRPRRAGVHRGRRARVHGVAAVRRGARCSSSTTSGAGSSTTSSRRASPICAPSADINNDFGQMGFRIPAVVVSPYARRGHVDHSIYGFESILKMIRYRYALPPLTPRDLYANNIAAAFDFESKPNFQPPALPTPPDVISSSCSGSTPVGTGGAGIDDGSADRRRRRGSQLQRPAAAAPQAARPPEPADLGLPGAARVQVPAGHARDDVPPPVEAGDAPLSGALRAAALGAVLAASLPAGLAGADSFTPVRLADHGRPDRAAAPAAADHRPRQRRSRRAR